jgi:hypothetical protein
MAAIVEGFFISELPYTLLWDKPNIRGGIMDSIDYGKGIKTKWIALKDKMHDLTQKAARRGSNEKEEVLRNNRELNMPITEMSSRIAQLKNEHRTEWTSQGKIIDNGSVANPGKYVLRPRISWTGLYGKEPWPREKKRWERI